MSITDEIKESFKKGSVLTRLIYINIGVFLLIRLINVLFFLLNRDFTLLAWLALPANFSALLSKPWTLFSYMFLHFDFLHILFNVLWLYWMGKIFLFYFDARKLLAVYILGGLSGGIFFLLAYNLFPAFTDLVSFSRLLGASASVLAIIAAVATHAPNHPINLLFIGEIKMKHLAIVSILLYVIGIAGSNAGGNLAHVGGAAFGFLFVSLNRRGTDITSWFTNLIESFTQIAKPKRHVKVSYRGTDIDKQYNQQKKVQQEEINRVLDKISKSGYDSLTKEEKELLFKMGK
ncbi:rhomboid family intramembrane serine protease [Mangrovibacterium sp.]|uniref:rhomboid family intramembrane serine protease n=1 Tax=Mangrovibacterium sp. TaxID=1961364 RepID=UPI00356679E1